MIADTCLNVVGNASSLLSQDYDYLIDFNPTIRFNCVPELKKGQGTRWDYMATSNPREIQRWNQIGEVPFHTMIFTPWSENAKGAISRKKFKSKLITIPDATWNSLAKINQKRPSTGLSVLYYLDSLAIPEVNVFGFDWKKTPSFYNNDSREKGENKFHDYVFEEQYCLKLIEKNGWKFYS